MMTYKEKSKILAKLLGWHCDTYFGQETLYFYWNSGDGRVGSAPMPLGIYDPEAMALLAHVLAWFDCRRNWPAWDHLTMSAREDFFGRWVQYTRDSFNFDNLHAWMTLCADFGLELAIEAKLILEVDIHQVRSIM